MKVPQMAPMNRKATARQSSDSVWPLRNKDGLTWAEAKGESHDPEQIAAGLTGPQRRILTSQTHYNYRRRKFTIHGDKRVLWRLCHLGLLADYICEPSLTPLGLAVRALISKDKNND